MNQQRYRGFTMLEVIVIIVVLGILGVAGSNMLGGLFTFSSVSNVNDATWQGRLALEKMSREIRVIRSPSDISLASGSQITFVDINGNSIDYTSSGSTVTRNTTQPLADGTTATFSYFDAAKTNLGVPVAAGNLPKIRYVTINLTITQGGVNYAMQTTVNPRNLFP